MVNTFRQPIYGEDKKFSGKFHYFNTGELCASYLNFELQSDKSLFIFYQFTGLKDYLGNRIWIGSILKVIETNCANEESIGFYEVFYDLNNNCLMLECLYSEMIKQGCNIFVPYQKYIQVISNNLVFRLEEYVKNKDIR